MNSAASHTAFPRFARIGPLGDVCRLGLATRGNTRLDADAVLEAVDRGVNYLNWCGHPDGMREAVRSLGSRRGEVFVAVQLESRTAAAARRELRRLCAELNTDYLDVVTYYYVEHPDEWREITSAGGAAEVVEAARHDGRVRAIGLTSHQRPLAAAVAEGRLDLLMVRYNAAHRGAERDVFPVTAKSSTPVVAFTCLRWGALLQPTPDDPSDFSPPSAVDCYRFTLAHPAVSVALMAPDGVAELRQNLMLLDDWRAPTEAEHRALAAHGARVRRHAGGFP